MSHPYTHNQPYTPHEKTGYAISDAKARNWAMYCHLADLANLTGVLFIGIFITLAIWIMKKDDHPFVDQQGREALNYQISYTLYMLLCIPLMLILIGIPLFVFLYFTSIILTIIASVTAAKGKPYRYPATIRFF